MLTWRAERNERECEGDELAELRLVGLEVGEEIAHCELVVWSMYCLR